MMVLKFGRTVALSLAVLSTIACKGGFENFKVENADENSEVQDNNFFGPSYQNGMIELKFNDDNTTFELTRWETSPSDDEPTYTYSGNVASLEKGFRQLTITEQTGTAPQRKTTNNNTDEQSNVIHIARFSDQMIFMRPFEQDNFELTVLIANTIGDCPDDFVGNWLVYNDNDSTLANSTTAAFFGDVNFTENDGVMTTLNTITQVNNGRLDSISWAATKDTCNNGISTNNAVRHFYSEAPNAIIQTGAPLPNAEADNNNRSILVVPQSKIATIQELSNQNYFGYLEDRNLANANKVASIIGQCTDQNCSLSTLSDSDLDSSSLSGSQTHVIEFEVNTLDNILQNENTPTNGWLQGRLFTVSETGDRQGEGGDIQCSINSEFLDTNQNAFFCVGQSPSDSQKLLNLFFWSKQ